MRNLRGQQGDYPKESTHLYWDELSSIYQAEHSVNLKPASQRDIASAHKTLSRYVSSLPEDNSLVFKMSRNVASKWFNGTVLPKALPDRAEDLVLHSMRYTMATLLKQSGCSENTAQDILGHSAQSLTFGLYGKTKSVDLMAEALSAALLNNQ